MISAAAELDLLELWLYVAENDEAAADRVLDNIVEVAAKLALWPEMGRERPNLRPSVRSFAAGKHVLFYRIQRGNVEIIRVLDGRRDVDSIL